MGQAQLLLIVLGTVVVGLAVMAGINAYEQNNIKSDMDAVVHECMRLASDAQTMAQKPETFGGLWDTADATEVAQGYDFLSKGATSPIGLADLGWPADGVGASSTIVIAPAAAQIVATCTSQKFNTANGTTANSVQVTVTGVNASDITTVVTNYVE